MSRIMNYYSNKKRIKVFLECMDTFCPPRTTAIYRAIKLSNDSKEFKND